MIHADPVFVVPGDMDGRISIKPEIEAELSKNNLSTKVVVVQKNMEVAI